MLPPSVSYKEIAPPSVLASLSLRTQQRPIPKEEEVQDLFGDLLFMSVMSDFLKQFAILRGILAVRYY